MEALVIVLDVGPSTGTLCADGGATFIDTALLCCDRIAQRKLFEDKNKDHMAVVVVGSEESDNRLADADADQYQHVSLARRLAPVDWPLVRMLSPDRLHATEAQGDWLDGLVVALDHLVEMSRTHKYQQRRIVLLTDFGGPLCTDQLDAIKAGLRKYDVDLMAIGTELATDGSDEMQLKPTGKTETADDLQMKTEDGLALGGGEPRPGPSGARGLYRHDGKAKTRQQLEGESAVVQLIRAVDGGFFTFEQALPQLLFFHKRKSRAAPWNAPLQIGESLSINITGYSQIKKVTMPSWRKLAAGPQPAPVKRRTTYERQDEQRSAVPFEKTERAYRYGTTLVPFSRLDQQELEYRSGAPRSIQVLGFTSASNVGPHLYQDTQTVQVVARRGDAGAEAALSALIHALQETDMVAVARRTYNNGGTPRLGALRPNIRHDLECLVWVQLPFAEDMRNPLFPPLPTAVPQETLSAVDQLIDAMDLTAPAAEEASERLEPGALLSPQFQRLYQVLAARALHPGEPLPPPDADLLRQLSPDPALAAPDALRAVAAACPLTELLLPHQRRETGRDVFQAAAAAAPDQAGPAATVTDLIKPEVTEVGTVNPAEDFDVLLRRDDVRFDELCSQMQRVISRLVRESLTRPALLEKTVAAIGRLRTACRGVSPAAYNAWVAEARGQLSERPAVWQRVVADRLGPIVASESAHPAAEEAEATRFYDGGAAAAAAVEAVQAAEQEAAEDLLDDL
ncbi:X-ray repair cross-complementing protein 5 [Amphibalanus amphitrite]|uniref:X-ray repair cross-complementing protein 5 n=1 Tax=Amphibalanus amphitrite TaxID=1232801 RepID=A0A6A4XDS2_AMPAM|nr:X-ray repair cross-complementing protein 5 [Amphibalanus amphitrite]